MDQNNFSNACNWSQSHNYKCSQPPTIIIASSVDLMFAIASYVACSLVLQVLCSQFFICLPKKHVHAYMDSMLEKMSKLVHSFSHVNHRWTTYLFHLAYLMYRTYISHPYQETQKKLLYIYVAINVTVTTISSALIVTLNQLQYENAFETYDGYWPLISSMTLEHLSICIVTSYIL